MDCPDKQTDNPLSLSRKLVQYIVDVQCPLRCKNSNPGQLHTTIPFILNTCDERLRPLS